MSVLGAFITFFVNEIVVHVDAGDLHFVVDDAIAAVGPTAALTPGEIGNGGVAVSRELRTGTSCADGAGGGIESTEVAVFAEVLLGDAIPTEGTGGILNRRVAAVKGTLGLGEIAGGRKSAEAPVAAVAEGDA